MMCYLCARYVFPNPPRPDLHPTIRLESGVLVCKLCAVAQGFLCPQPGCKQLPEHAGDCYK